MDLDLCRVMSMSMWHHLDSHYTRTSILLGHTHILHVSECTHTLEMDMDMDIYRFHLRILVHVRGLSATMSMT